MANTKFTDLPPVIGPLSGDEIVAVVQPGTSAGTSKRATTSQLQGLASQENPVDIIDSTYAVVESDRRNLLSFSGACAVTLPAAGGNFSNGWFCDFNNRGSGLVTITSASLIDGAASLVLAQNQGVRIASDGSTYYCQRGGGYGVQAANKVFAGPAAGADAAPTFRSLAAADLPGSDTGALLTVTSAGTHAVADNIAVVQINLGAPGTVTLTVGSVDDRAGLSLAILDWAGNATINFTPDGAETLMGISGTVGLGTSSGQGIGSSIAVTLYPRSDLSGWYYAP